MHVKLAESDEDIDRAATVLLELRDAFDKPGLVAQIREQRAAGYRVAFVEDNGNVLCVAGFVIGSKLAWGRFLYVDDLVTDERHRSQGAGTLMLSWLKTYAAEQGCGQVHLDSGVARFAAHRFYLRHGFRISSHHFSIEHLET